MNNLPATAAPSGGIIDTLTSTYVLLPVAAIEEGVAG